MAKKPNECPLFQHRNKQWAKKCKGKLLYFGTDLDAALKRWADEKDYHLAGLIPPSRKPGAASLQELGNLFIARCRDRVSAGEMTQVSVTDYIPTLKRLMAILGESRQPESLTPMDFANLKNKLAEPVQRTKEIKGGTLGMVVERRSPTTVAGHVRRIRSFLNWCAASKLIPPPDYGDDFAPITAKARQRVDAKQRRKDISSEDIRAIIEVSSVHFKPVLLMAANAGIGNKDLAEMRFACLPDGWQEMSEVWLDLPRLKTGTDRRFPLWPETKAALLEYLEKRANPAGRSNADRLFLTKYGHPWLREIEGDRKDAVSANFKRCRQLAKVTRGTFYDVRRTFQTIGAETLDFPAVSFVMGHARKQNDMAARYTQHISDERVRAVVNHVRAWLFDGVAE